MIQPMIVQLVLLSRVYKTAVIGHNRFRGNSAAMGHALSHHQLTRASLWRVFLQLCSCQSVQALDTARPLHVPCRIFVLYLVPTVYRFKYYFAWAVAESALTVSGFNYNGENERGIHKWDRYVNTRIKHVEFQTSLAKLPEHWNVCTGLFLRQCTATI